MWLISGWAKASRPSLHGYTGNTSIGLFTVDPFFSSLPTLKKGNFSLSRLSFPRFWDSCPYRDVIPYRKAAESPDFNSAVSLKCFHKPLEY